MKPSIEAAFASMNAELATTCFERGRPVRLARSKQAALSMAFPPLLPSGTLGGVPVASLTQDFYWSEPVPLARTMIAWNEAVPLLLAKRPSTRRAVELMRQVHTNVPFSVGPGDDVRAMLVQFLAATSWYHGRLRLTPKTVTLFLPEGMTISIDQNGVEAAGRRTRLAVPLDFSFEGVVTSPIGKREVLRVGIAGLFRHLIHVIPESSHQIAAMIMTAVALGEEAEEHVLSFYNVQWDHTTQRQDSAAWSEVLRVIDSALSRPYTEVMALLVPHVMSRQQFVSAFGTEQRSTKFTDIQRKRYRAIALKAQGIKEPKALTTASPSSDAPPTEEEKAIRELEQLLGGSL